MYRPPRVGLYWRARQDRLPGAADARALRGRRGRRHRVLHHGLRARTRPHRPGDPRPDPARARDDLRLAQRSPGAPSHGGLAGARPRRFREARELLRAPDPPVDPAIPRLRDGEDRGDGAIDRVDARARPARGRDDAGARRLPSWQYDHPPYRAARRRGARLGALHTRPSARRSRLQLPALPLHARVGRARRQEPGGARDPDRGGVRRGLLPPDGARRGSRLELLSRVRDVPAGRDRAGNHGTGDRRHRQRSERARAGCARPPARRVRLGARRRARRLSEPRSDGLELMMTNADAIEIERAARVDEELVSAFRRLVPQLSSSAPAPTVDQLREMIESPCTTVLLARARAGGDIIGSLTLAVFRIPTGVRAWIEDVVVDSSARGRGVGEALSREALRLAVEKGARTVELTSRPSRAAANRLYRRLGFVERETSVYRYTLNPAARP